MMKRFLWAMLLCSVSAWAGDDCLKNADFKKGKSKWQGDADLVYLKPDGTEGAEEDAGAIPVLKVKLKKSESNFVYQEFKIKDPKTTLSVSVEVRTSDDFKRTDNESLYTKTAWKAGATWYWSGVEVPPVDFWIRVGSGWLYKMADAKVEWQKVEGNWTDIKANQERSLYFCVPPGTGAVYIKNPVVTP